MIFNSRCYAKGYPPSFAPEVTSGAPRVSEVTSDTTVENVKAGALGRSDHECTGCMLFARREEACHPIIIGFYKSKKYVETG